ncbi:hypothetical protein OUZ56_003619 [Daphnia magna]|uniref:Uncharacterized protein n=1 Tax=Daphnia magna TaxID=35525 RepID=A0ABR0A988_9CRUS|nr:hypothetical protein OUZ56_003619 [Daphnia magna]
MQTEDIMKEPSVYLTDVMAETENPRDQNTEEELCVNSIIHIDCMEVEIGWCKSAPTRHPANFWLKVIGWIKLKDSNITYKDSVEVAGSGATKPFAIYEELHGLVGSRAILRPKTLSSSLPMGKNFFLLAVMMK